MIRREIDVVATCLLPKQDSRVRFPHLALFPSRGISLVEKCHLAKVESAFQLRHPAQPIVFVVKYMHVLPLLLGTVPARVARNTPAMPIVWGLHVRQSAGPAQGIEAGDGHRVDPAARQQFRW